MTDEEKRMVELNNYIDDLNIDALIKFMNGESDDFGDCFKFCVNTKN